jgi:hypothetical protein
MAHPQDRAIRRWKRFSLLTAGAAIGSQCQALPRAEATAYARRHAPRDGNGFGRPDLAPLRQISQARVAAIARHPPSSATCSFPTSRSFVHERRASLKPSATFTGTAAIVGADPPSAQAPRRSRGSILVVLPSLIPCCPGIARRARTSWASRALGAALDSPWPRRRTAAGPWLAWGPIPIWQDDQGQLLLVYLVIMSEASARRWWVFRPVERQTYALAGKATAGATTTWAEAGGFRPRLPGGEVLLPGVPTARLTRSATRLEGEGSRATGVRRRVAWSHNTAVAASRCCAHPHPIAIRGRPEIPDSPASAPGPASRTSPPSRSRTSPTCTSSSSRASSSTSGRTGTRAPSTRT